MYSGEMQPAFLGSTYSDELQMVHADTGAPLPFVAGLDQVTVRVLPLDGRTWARGFLYAFDYGFGLSGGPSLSDVSLLTLSIGAGVTITGSGTALWVVQAWPLWLREPEYRLAVDLTRYGETCRVVDAVLSVER